MPRPTFEFRFRIAGIPVVVSPSFWLMVALLGFQPGRPLVELAVWVAVVFASVLVHELGHALAARRLGTGSSVRLYAFGGLTIPDRRLPRFSELAMVLAGPFAGFLVGGLAWAVWAIGPDFAGTTGLAIDQLIWINVGWGLANLVPVLPLDGGHALLGLLGPRRQRLGTLLCAVGGLGAALVCVLGFDQLFPALIFAFLALRNLHARVALGAPPDGRADDLLRQGWQALASGDERTSERLASEALEAAGDPDARNRARDLLAWSALARANPRDALRLLRSSEPPEAARPLSFALCLEALGDLANALPHAVRAVQREPSETSAALAVRLLARAGDPEDAAHLANAFAWNRPAGKEAALAQIALARGAHAEAALHFAAVFDAEGRPGDAYQAALALACSGAEGEARGMLRRALEAGFDDLEQLRAEPALAATLADPEIGRLIEGSSRA